MSLEMILMSLEMTMTTQHDDYVKLLLVTDELPPPGLHREEFL